VLVGERERLDLEPVGVAQQAVEVEAEGVCGELGREAGAQAAEGVGVVVGEAELLRELGVDGLDDLAGGLRSVLWTDRV